MLVVAGLIFVEKVLRFGERLSTMFATAFVGVGIWVGAAPASVVGIWAGAAPASVPASPSREALKRRRSCEYRHARRE